MSSHSLFQDLLNTISERGLRMLAPISGNAPTAQSLIDQCDILISNRGEASGVAYARRVLRGYEQLDDEQCLEFFRELARRYHPDTETVKIASDAYINDPNPRNLAELLQAAAPPRQELFRRLNLAPGGTAVLVGLRKGMLKYLLDEPELEAIENDLAYLFDSWFNRGFLVLKHIDWRTPANVLEKIIQYEAVHEINGWEDLRRRVYPPDRRCFAFFHPSLGDEPLIFVEVALTLEVPMAIAEVLNEQDENFDIEQARTAVFYSISNCQEGLRGVSFGNFLIKQVAEELASELPELKKFVTLSPIPGFLKWLQNSPDGVSKDIAYKALASIIDDDWHIDPDKSKKARELLLPLAAFYLLEAKRDNNLPVDPVTGFHIGNGASLDRINWLGDVSQRGLKQSAGIMVNYLYDLKKIEKNHEAYVANGSIAASRNVKAEASQHLKSPSKPSHE
jgi:malonyl-CoA decarboxylase